MLSLKGLRDETLSMHLSASRARIVGVKICITTSLEVIDWYPMDIGVWYPGHTFCCLHSVHARLITFPSVLQFLLANIVRDGKSRRGGTNGGVAASLMLAACSQRRGDTI